MTPRQTIQVLSDLFLGQSGQALLGGQPSQHLLLLLVGELREVLLDELPPEILHRKRHGIPLRLNSFKKFDASSLTPRGRRGWVNRRQSSRRIC